jgi:hypothetical protein
VVWEPSWVEVCIYYRRVRTKGGWEVDFCLGLGRVFTILWKRGWERFGYIAVGRAGSSQEVMETRARVVPTGATSLGRRKSRPAVRPWIVEWKPVKMIVPQNLFLRIFVTTITNRKQPGADVTSWHSTSSLISGLWMNKKKTTWGKFLKPSHGLSPNELDSSASLITQQELGSRDTTMQSGYSSGQVTEGISNRRGIYADIKLLENDLARCSNCANICSCRMRERELLAQHIGKLTQESTDTPHMSYLSRYEPFQCRFFGTSTWISSKRKKKKA